jgi:hypothetical protein
MKKKLLALSTFIFFVLYCNAQSNLITVENENNADGSITINSNNYAGCKYTVKLSFNSLSGFLNTGGISPLISIINPGRTQVTKLIPDQNNGYRSLNYSYSYYAGISYRKAPNNYTHYMLPVTPGKTTLVTKVSALSNLMGQKQESFFYTQGFTYNLGDTICATRAGYVYNINDQLKQGEGGNTVFTDSRNKIYIQHKDGTLGYYTILAPISCLVQNGDYVIPGQPIAIFNKTAEKYTMLFSTYYLDEEKIRTENPKEIYQALPTYYFLNENAPSTTLVENQKYESIKSLSIIAEELSKRDKKKLGL